MTEELSKTKRKRLERAAEREQFLKARKMQNFVLWEMALNQAIETYEKYKHELPEEDQLKIEAQIEADKKLGETYRAELGLEDLPLANVDSLDSGPTGQVGDDGETSPSDLG